MRFYTTKGKYLTVDYFHKTYSKSYNQFKVNIHLKTQKINIKQYNKLCTNLKKEGFNEAN